jgi:hypothetical protein
MTYRIALLDNGGLIIEYGEGGDTKYLYSARAGAPIKYDGKLEDWGPPRIVINHNQLMQALEALAQDAPGDYSNR